MKIGSGKRGKIFFLKLNMKDENVFYRYIYLYDNNKNIYKL